MKSRLAIVAALAFGTLFTTAGAGLAVSGVTSGADNASVAQYGAPPPPPTAPGEGIAPVTRPTNGPPVSPAEESPTPTPTIVTPTTGPTTEVAHQTNAPPVHFPPEEIQPTRQVEVSTASRLPVTGFAAIPVLLGGIALLTGGLVLRRRSRPE
jgi:LPXTG-motif cell wall-anchored protein